MSFASMPLYTGDYLRDTRHLTPLKHGIYLLALMHCWDSKGPIPLDEQETAGICNCRSADEIDALRYVLERFFIRMDDGHYNKRMAGEVAKFERLSKTLSGAGLRSAEARRDKARRGSRAQVQPRFNLGLTQVEPRLVSPSPSPSPSLTPSLTPGDVSPDPSQPPNTGVASGKQPRKRASKPANEGNSAVWAAYCHAYSERYGAEPVRNAKVNGQIARFVERLGVDESPGVARAYLSNRNSLYVSAKHCTDLMLRDAEKLRTEWATGNVVHQREAQEADRLSATGEMWKRVGQKLKERGIE